MHTDQFAPNEAPEHPLRRSSDFAQSDFLPTNPSNADLLREIRLGREEITKLQASVGAMRDAFILNDIGKPDFEGHRVAHRKMVDAEKTLQIYKVDATKKVLSWIVGIALALFATGANTHLAKLFGV